MLPLSSIQALEQLAIPRQRVETTLDSGAQTWSRPFRLLNRDAPGQPDLPQAERSHRRQERDPSADGIQPLAAGELPWQVS